jgi:hypothetical protein
MSTKFTWLALVFCVSLQFLQIESAKLDGNGYTLTVAVSEDFISSVADEVTFTDSLKVHNQSLVKNKGDQRLDFTILLVGRVVKSFSGVVQSH